MGRRKAVLHLAGSLQVSLFVLETVAAMHLVGASPPPEVEFQVIDRGRDHAQLGQVHSQAGQKHLILLIMLALYAAQEGQAQVCRAQRSQVVVRDEADVSAPSSVGGQGAVVGERADEHLARVGQVSHMIAMMMLLLFLTLFPLQKGPS